MEQAKYIGGPPPPYLARPYPQPGGKFMVTVDEVAPLPDHWPLLIADIVTDCRFTLDYLAYQLVIRHTGQDPPPNAVDIEFPVSRGLKTDEEGELSKGSAFAKIKDTSIEVRRFIDRVQPYNMPGSDGKAEHNGLWIVHQLTNAYKHRLLSPAALLSKQVEVTISIQAGAVERVEATNYDVSRPLGKGTELAEFRLIGSQPGTKIQVATQPTAYIGLEPGTPLEREPVWDFLNGTVGTVGWITEELTEIGDLTAP